MTGDLGHPVLCTQAVAAAVGYGGGLVELGKAGSDELAVWGWTPPALAAPGGPA
jgi:hypothetical protein